MKTIEEFSERDTQDWVYVTVFDESRKVYRGVATKVTSAKGSRMIQVDFCFGKYPYYFFPVGEYRIQVKALNAAVKWALVFEEVA